MTKRNGSTKAEPEQLNIRTGSKARGLFKIQCTYLAMRPGFKALPTSQQDVGGALVLWFARLPLEEAEEFLLTKLRFFAQWRAKEKREASVAAGRLDGRKTALVPAVLKQRTLIDGTGKTESDHKAPKTNTPRRRKPPKRRA